MLIKEILQEDVANCRESLQKDHELQDLEDKFYHLMESAKEVKFELEDVFSAYIARCIRIAYLQGIKDFAELFVVLKRNTHEILTEFIDQDAGIEQTLTN